MSMYNLRPLEILESFQNFGMDDINDMDLNQLKEEYKRALNERENMKQELEDLKNSRVSTYEIKERIENSTKYIDKIEKKLNPQISDEEIQRIKDSEKGTYGQKKEEEI